MEVVTVTLSAVTAADRVPVDDALGTVSVAVATPLASVSRIPSLGDNEPRLAVSSTTAPATAPAVLETVTVTVPGVSGSRLPGSRVIAAVNAVSVVSPVPPVPVPLPPRMEPPPPSPPQETRARLRTVNSEQYDLLERYHSHS